MASQLKFRRLTRIGREAFWIAMQPDSQSPVWIMWRGPGTKLQVSMGSMFVDVDDPVAHGVYRTLEDAERAVERFQRGAVH